MDMVRGALDNTYVTNVKWSRMCSEAVKLAQYL